MIVLDSTIPPEQQAEAKELAAVLAEMNNNMQHDYQDLVSGQGLHCVHYRHDALKHSHNTALNLAYAP